MEEEEIVKVERRFLGRVPYEYEGLRETTILEADSGFGEAGAKLDPRSGALMYDKFGDIYKKQKIMREEQQKPRGVQFSRDSQAMIHFKEDEEATMGPSGLMKVHSARGIVSVRNLSDKDRLWDILVRLQDENGVAMVDFDYIDSTEIEPREKVSKEYKIDNINPSILYNEIISTHPELPESVIVEKGRTTRVMYQLELKNQSTIPYEDVVVKKEIPKTLDKINLLDDAVENVKQEDGWFLWRLPELPPGAGEILRFEGELSPEGISEETTGDVTVTATGVETLTHFIITSYDAMCRNMYFIEADETEEPGRWICNFICENTSSFEVEILKIDIRDSSMDKRYMDVVDPGVRVPPNKRWESKPWIVEGKERPSFIKNVVLNVIPGLEKEMKYKLNKEGARFFVAGLAFTKKFDKDIAIANRLTDFKATIEVENTGSADLEHILVRDLLPPFMSPPSSYMVQRGIEHLTENVKVTLTPEDVGLDGKRQLAFQIMDMSKYGGPLAPGEKITITYTGQLVRPAPEAQIEARAEADGKPYLPGPLVSGTDRGSMPVIGIKQVLRKFSIGKSIEQGSGIGEYNIGILYKNRGNQPIKDLIIKDILPRNFTGSGFTQDPEKEATPDEGTILKWTIPVLNEGETTTILYKITGEGEYHPTDAQIFYNSNIE
jgi:hypothetical protein